MRFLAQRLPRLSLSIRSTGDRVLVQFGDGDCKIFTQVVFDGIDGFWQTSGMLMFSYTMTYTDPGLVLTDGLLYHILALENCWPLSISQRSHEYSFERQ